jgi:hypothetical protein
VSKGLPPTPRDSEPTQRLRRAAGKQPGPSRPARTQHSRRRGDPDPRLRHTRSPRVMTRTRARGRRPSACLALLFAIGASRPHRRNSLHLRKIFRSAGVQVADIWRFPDGICVASSPAQLASAARRMAATRTAPLEAAVPRCKREGGAL